MNCLDRARRTKALADWLARCRDDMGKENRYPEIDLDSDIWDIRSKYKTNMRDVTLSSTWKAFAGLDSSYSQAIRCVAAEWAIADEIKSLTSPLKSWKLLARTGPPSLLDLQRSHLQKLEKILIEECKIKPRSAGGALTSLKSLARFVDRIQRVGVIEPVSWSPAHDTIKVLNDLQSQQRHRYKAQKATTLDRQIEALSDAMNALFNGDERLSDYDRSALATIGILMCAPSRINEPMCMAIDDIINIEDYSKNSDDRQESKLRRVHALLLQKGSKGADWTAKPALTFMFGLLTLCIQVLKDSGKRSRMLAKWYEKNPKKLYLPTALEIKRGKVVTRKTLWQLVNLSERIPTSVEISRIDYIWEELQAAGKVHTVENPAVHRSDVRLSHARVQAVSWDDIEAILLRRVREAMNAARRVTPLNHYVGRLSDMLMLFDGEKSAYLPGSIRYSVLSKCFKQTQAYRNTLLKRNRPIRPTIFEKLGLTMVVNGKVEYAWLETHDPRRWLTTQALLARERLSDVLINKWANRLSIEQLKHYDLRSDAQTADQASMPVAQELTDISAGLERIMGIEAEYGLKTDIVTAHEAGVSVTSMEAIALATQDRPVARTSSQIIILYPSRFGVCLHQHHETPCRSYTSCLPCSENIVVKGHLPTNDEVRKRDELLTRSIIDQLERLVTAHNREIADRQEGLEAHLLTLVRQGLTAEELSEELIIQFHEIKDRIKSARLRNELEEAYVARGMVQRLDDPNVASGALMRYHNAARHASPGHERALEAHGGRSDIDHRLQQFHREHPEFAPRYLGLKDQREQLVSNEDDDDDDE